MKIQDLELTGLDWCAGVDWSFRGLEDTTRRLDGESYAGLWQSGDDKDALAGAFVRAEGETVCPD